MLRLTDSSDANRLTNGIKIELPVGEQNGGVALKLKPNALYMAIFEEQPLGVVQVVSERLKPVKIFPGR